MSATKSLKTHLALLFFLAILVPVAVTALVTYHHLGGEMAATVEQKNLTLARAVAGEVETFLLSPRYVLGNIRQLVLHPLASGAAHDTRAVLDTHVSGASRDGLPAEALFESVYLIDAAGRVAEVGLSPAMEKHRGGFLGLDLSHQGFISRARDTGTPTWSDTFLSLISGRMSLALAVPAAEQGVLVGNFNLDLLQRAVERFGRDTTTQVAVIGRDGSVIAHTDPAVAARKFNLSHLAVVRSALEAGGATQQCELDGIPCLGSAAPIPGPGWAALVSQPTATAFAPIRHTALLAGGVAAVTLVLGTWLALAVARRYAEPLSQLTEQARRAAAGEYHFPSVRGSYREVETLGQTFSEMLAALGAREEQLAESERRHRELAELLPQVVFETDLAGNVTYANQYALDLFGFTREDLAAGLPVLSMIAAEDRQRAQENMALRLRGEEAPSNEYGMVAADGSPLSVLIYSSPVLRDGHPVGLRGVLVDITRRRVVEDALRFTQFAMDHLSDAAYFIRPDGGIAYVNEAACADLGYSREELLALSVSAVNPELTPARWRDHWEQARRDGFLQTTTSHRTKGGESLPVEIAVNYVAFVGEEYLCAVARDLSERMALEERVRQSQKMEAVGTLASGIAHDFNNLLQAIAGYTELLLAATSDTRSRQRLSQIAAAADSAANLVQQILTFSRRSTPVRRPIDLNREVSHAVEMLRRTLPKMVHIEEQLAPDLWHVSADATQVEQVLMNLGTNARDAMPGGGRLTVTTRNRHIDHHPELGAGPYVELTVRDDGAGMEPETRERIFEPFFTTKGVGEGTGLGLSTVYGVVQAHGGHLRCDSTPGSGTTFTITLPALPDAPNHVSGTEPRVAPLPGGKERVLVVDDEEMVRELAGSALETCGYQVALAERGEEALELYRTALTDNGNDGTPPFQAVILDLGMPGMGGRRCLDELLRLDPGARVLVASGYGDPILQSDVLVAGAAAFVGKPYRLHELCESLRGVLDGGLPVRPKA